MMFKYYSGAPEYPRPQIGILFIILFALFNSSIVFARNLTHESNERSNWSHFAPKGKIYCIGKLFADKHGAEKNDFPKTLARMLANNYELVWDEKNLSTNNDVGSERDKLSDFNRLVAEKGDFVFLDINAEIASLNDKDNERSKLLEKTKSLINAGARVVLLVLPSPLDDKSKAKNSQLLKEFALKSNAEIVDFLPALSRSDAYEERKGLTANGSTLIAKRLFELIKTPIVGDADINLKDVKIDNFGGYVCSTFYFEGREAKIVKPKRVAKGKPWIWRARFWGHEPQLDIAMLERGYHIVYCDVSELFGNDEALQIWDRFYQFLQKSGLNKKSIMEGMSRGGVYIYNWMFRYPDRVSVVYADAPVLDFKSWPGGKGKGQGSSENWEIFKKDYQLTEQEAINFKHSPLDRAAELGALKIPAIHVVGDIDDIVPPEENTLPFAKLFIAAGGKMEIIHKAHVGHHPHSLVDPSPIIDFLLKAEKRNINFTANNALSFKK